MFAIVEIGGKQYKVSPGEKIKIEKLETLAGEDIVFDKILLTVDGDKVAVGSPYVAGVVVEGKVNKHGRNKKVIVFKYHSKTRYRKKKGHRQHFTEVEITGIK